MSKKIMSLSPEQKARFPEFVRKWTDIGLSTMPADRERAERAISGLYGLAGIKRPRIIWLPCPISAALSAVCYAAIINHRLVGGQKPVGSAVDSAVRSAGFSYFGGSIWNAGYGAWADYFNEACGVSIDRHFLDATESCGFYWTLDGVCFASERPSEINLDADGRLHCETGMSIRYAGTGWGLHHWHGTRVPAEWIEHRAELTAKEALSQQNIEQRRAALDIVGWHKALRELKAKVIDEHPDPRCGALVEVQLPDLDRKSRFIHAECGTGREFAIGVPPGIKTVVEAQAWLTGLPVSEFQFPTIRT